VRENSEPGVLILGRGEEREKRGRKGPLTLMPAMLAASRVARRCASVYLVLRPGFELSRQEAQTGFELSRLSRFAFGVWGLTFGVSGFEFGVLS